MRTLLTLGLILLSAHAWADADPVYSFETECPIVISRAQNPVEKRKYEEAMYESCIENRMMAMRNHQCEPRVEKSEYVDLPYKEGGATTTRKATFYLKCPIAQVPMEKRSKIDPNNVCGGGKTDKRIGMETHWRLCVEIPRNASARPAGGGRKSATAR